MSEFEKLCIVFFCAYFLGFFTFIAVDEVIKWFNSNWQRRDKKFRLPGGTT